ncbi:MAG: PspC domain-containing protein [Bacteroidales bacterium]
MKKTIRINISGLIFNIDEDAYNKLQQYLGSITNKFLNTNEGNEIIADVEARIAELFQERIGDRKEVINLPDIDYVIEIMGAPEEFEDSQQDEPDREDEIPDRKPTRKIYRDSEKRVLGGLAAGIAAYFNIDPLIVRVIFIVFTLFYGTSILVYLLLWIMIPEAKTRSQKLEMRGKDINLSNIETSIKSEFHEVKKNFQKWQKSGGYENLRENIGSILSFSGKVMIVFLKFILIMIGISFLIFGIGMLGTMTGVFFLNNTFLSPFSWNGIEFKLHDMITMFTDGFTARVGIISTYLLLLIPVLSIIYVGLKFIFRIKTRNKYIGLYAGSLWLVSLLVLLGAIVKIGYGMRSTEEVVQTYPINNLNSDTLYFRMADGEEINNWDERFINFGSVFVNMKEDDMKLMGQPNLSVIKSENKNITVKFSRRSDGETKAEALKYAKNIRYDWQQVDSLFYFKRYYQIDGPKKLKDQRVDIDFEIPVGKIVYFDNNIGEITGRIDFVNSEWPENIDRKYWIMTENGLMELGDYKKDMKDGKLDFNEPENIVDSNSTSTDEIEKMKQELDSM